MMDNGYEWKSSARLMRNGARSMERQTERRWKRIAWYFLPAALSLIVYSVSLALNGLYPWGGRLLFGWDAIDQMIPFLAWLRRAILSGEELLYTLQSSFGIDNIGMYAYYLASPLNYLVCLFPEDALVDAYMVLLYLRMALAATTFFLYARRSLRAGRLTSLLFSLGYSLMSYVVVLNFYLMWMDGVVFLPLVMMAVHRLVEKDDGLPLVFAYFGAFWSNYYTGFMIAVYSVLYFIALSAIRGQGRWIKRAVSQGLRLALWGFLALGMVCVIILPAFLQLREISDAVGQPLIAEYGFESIWVWIASMTTGGAVGHYDSTFFYAGLVSLVLLIAFFICKGLSIRTRVAYGLLLFALVITAQHTLTRAFWTLTDVPQGFDFRNAFVFSFTVLVAGVLMMEALRERKPGALSASLKGVLFVGLFLFGVNALLDEPLELNAYFVNFALLMCWGIVFYKGHSAQGWKKRCAAIAMVVLMCADLGVNAFWAKESDEYFNDTEYFSRGDQIAEVMADIREADEGALYRLGDEYPVTGNDGMLFDYASPAGYASTANRGLTDYMNAMGFSKRKWYYWSSYMHNIVTDSLLNIRYVYPYNPANTYYEARTTSSGQHYFVNPYALPLFFASNGSFEGIGYERNQEKKWIFWMQRELVNRVAPDAEVVSLPWVVMDQENQTARYEMETTGPVYVSIPRGVWSLSATVNGEVICDYPEMEYYDWQLLLCSAEVGDVVEVRLGGEEQSIDVIGLGQVNLANFSALCREIGSKTTRVERRADGQFYAEVEIQQGDKLFITLPYEAGWTMKANGREVPIHRALSEFMGAELEPGKYEIELNYRRIGGVEGLWISIACWAVVLGILGYRMKRYCRRSGDINKS